MAINNFSFQNVNGLTIQAPVIVQSGDSGTINPVNAIEDAFNFIRDEQLNNLVSLVILTLENYLDPVTNTQWWLLVYIDPQFQNEQPLQVYSQFP